MDYIYPWIIQLNARRRGITISCQARLLCMGYIYMLYREICFAPFIHVNELRGVIRNMSTPVIVYQSPKIINSLNNKATVKYWSSDNKK